MKRIQVLFMLEPHFKKFLDDYSKFNRIPKSAIIEHLITKLMKGEVKIELCQPTNVPVEEPSKQKKV